MNCHAHPPEADARHRAAEGERAADGAPIAWTRVHALPDFVYFNHSQHVIGNVACRECHGAVETMERVRQEAPLTMGWCIDCHRARARGPAFRRSPQHRLRTVPLLADRINNL